MDSIDVALLVMRAAIGLGVAAHGLNKVFGGGGLAGTARWFGSMGMRFPALQARLAASTEIGAGILLAVGLLTPFAAAGLIGVMLVALWVAHRHNGFFIFNKGEGWEYTAFIAVVAWGIGTIGPGELSIDEAIDLRFEDWTGALIAGLLGVGAAVGTLVTFYRPPAPPAPSA